VDGDLGDFIEQQGAAVGEFKLSFLALDGPGESTLFMAEQFTFEQPLRQRGAVEGDERPVSPVAVLVDVASEHFLAGTAFTLNEDSGAGGGNLSDHLFESKHLRILANDGPLAPGSSTHLCSRLRFEESDR